MPELPEVEITVRDISPILCGKTITDVYISKTFDHKLAQSKHLKSKLKSDESVQTFLNKSAVDCKVENVGRQGRYILVGFECGTLAIHLGMSGALLRKDNAEAGPFEHFGLRIEKDCWLRLRTLRPFGYEIRWSDAKLNKIKIIEGRDPLNKNFDGAYLYSQIKNLRTRVVKDMLTDDKFVAGVGNIYSVEALFRAKISPKKRAKDICETEYSRLASCIQDVLQEAISAGGTTLEGFVRLDGKTRGHFTEKLRVYGRNGMPCIGECNENVQKDKENGNSSTYYCKNCQLDTCSCKRCGVYETGYN